MAAPGTETERVRQPGSGSVKSHSQTVVALPWVTTSAAGASVAAAAMPREQGIVTAAGTGATPVAAGGSAKGGVTYANGTGGQGNGKALGHGK